MVAQVAAGAESVQRVASWAGVLPDDEFARWSVEPTRSLVARFKEFCPNTPVIGFPKGAGVHLGTYVEGTGIDAVSADQTVPLELMAEIQKLCPVQGNLDPILLMTGGKALAARVKATITAMKNRPHIFNLGHGILPQTPPEHVADLIARVRASH